MKTIVKLETVTQNKPTQRGGSFDRAPTQVQFDGPFDAEAIRKQLQPDYTGCLYRPITIADVTQIGPNLAEYTRIISNGD